MIRFLLASLTIFLVSSAFTVPSSASINHTPADHTHGTVSTHSGVNDIPAHHTHNTVSNSKRNVVTLRHLRGGGGRGSGGVMKLSVNVDPIQSNINAAPAQPNQLSAQFLEAHNGIRSHFKQPLLTWDASLAAEAQSWVQAHKTECELDESSGNDKYGENSLWALESKNWTPEEVVGTWADEFRDYNQHTKVCFSESVCGYSTQLLWKNTQRLGCGFVDCDANKGSLFICFYDPKTQN